jgi:cytochrome c-type biogenesis protein
MLSMGLFLLGSMVLQAPWLYQEARFQPDLGRYGAFAPPIAGMAFGFGWVPCIGPTLASVLAIAAADGRASRGALLLTIYTLGLGIPFLVVGLTLGKLSTTLDLIKRNFSKITGGAALVLVLFGVLLTFNQLTWLTGVLQDGLRSIGLDVLVELG